MEIESKKILARFIGKESYRGFWPNTRYTIYVKGNTVVREDGKGKHEYASIQQFLSYWDLNTNQKKQYKQTIHKYDKHTGDFVKTYNSQGEAAQAHGVTRYAISKALVGKTKACKGFIFSETLKDNIFNDSSN